MKPHGCKVITYTEDSQGNSEDMRPESEEGIREGFSIITKTENPRDKHQTVC
jgi:hypothetical protein